MSGHENYPGRRLSFDGALCTVRYVGSVKGTKGDWLGVEWDDPNRGKHDGSHDGVRYFKWFLDSLFGRYFQSSLPAIARPLSAWTHSLYESGRSASHTAASFIRPFRPSDQPSGFFEALKEKYASSSAEDIAATANEIHISGKTVEEVGFEKIRQQLAELQELRIVVLDGARISVVESDLGEQNLKIIELDLSKNLLESWCEVTAICKSLHYMRSLRLDGNTFSRPQAPFKYNEPHTLHERLKELSLNNLGHFQQRTTGLDGDILWEFVRDFTSILPSLTTLSLASNNLTKIIFPLQTPLLTKLDLSSNAFTALERIRPLTTLPNLQTLSLRANPLTSLSSPPDKEVVFPKLKQLDLVSTLLPTLSSLNPIPKSFPALKSLLTNHTPLTTYPSASLHTIARLATLTQLNYSQITSRERQDAELYYLSQISKQLAAATDAIEEQVLLNENPRWAQLCATHGQPTPTKKPTTEKPAAGAGTLAARVTAFTFYIKNQDLETARKHAQGITGHLSNDTTAKYNPEPKTQHQTPTHHGNLPITTTTTTTTTEIRKPIPRTVDIYRLKGIVGTLFAIRPLSVKLIWESDEWDPVRAEDEDGGWSVSEDDDDDGGEREVKREREREKGRWKRRETELVDGTRAVGFFIDGSEARVRVEVR